MHAWNRISFAGHAQPGGPRDGFSYAGFKFVEALSLLGYEVLWKDKVAPVSISFTQPQEYLQEPHQYKVGYTPWESTELPPQWKPMIYTQDELWTTSNFCKEVFESHELDLPIKVVPHGIDATEWTLSKRKVRDKFWFIHMGEPAERKNGQMVTEAFMEVFGGNHDVGLIIKANEFSTIRLHNPWRSLKKEPQVDLITDFMDVFSLNELFHKAHCMVYPSSGEGWGLIPFQSLATGMPTIIVPWGGVKDFSHWGVPVSYTQGPTGHKWHSGEWAHPDFDDLCQQMLNVYENYDKLSSLAYSNAKELRKEYTWGEVAKDAMANLKVKFLV